MSDNYQNYWGRFLFQETKTAIKQSSHETSTSSFNRLKNSFEVKCDPFKFINTFSSGTQALQWCMTTSTFMRIDQLLIACGSYISGDNNSVLTNLGTSDMINKYGRIRCENLHPEAMSHTIALPYFIDATDTRVETLESDCLEELHSRCLNAKLTGSPIKTVVMELILNITGATLSDSFLEKLAELSKIHNFHFIIDEIITAGRTGTILYTLQKPQSFIDRIMYIALGKWLGMGVVLCNPANVNSENFGRGETTGTNYNKASAALELVSKNVDKADSRRKEVLEKLGVTEEESWRMLILRIGTRM